MKTKKIEEFIDQLKEINQLEITKITLWKDQKMNEFGKNCRRQYDLILRLHNQIKTQSQKQWQEVTSHSIYQNLMDEIRKNQNLMKILLADGEQMIALYHQKMNHSYDQTGKIKNQTQKMKTISLTS